MSGLDGWIQIFRAGRWTDSAGRTDVYTRADLDGIVERHDPGQPSQCVITHDELYSPFGFGAAAELRREGDALEMRLDPDTVDPQFRALVESGRLSQRSVQLLPLEGGGLRLGHVAWLGAEPPAVEGLAPIRMAAGPVRTYASDAWREARNERRWADMMRAIRALAAKVLDADEADRLAPQWEEDAAREEAGALRERAEKGDGDVKTESQSYSREDLDAAKAAAKAEARAEAEREFAAARREAERPAAQARVDALAPKLAEPQREGLAELALMLPDEPALEYSRPGANGAETVKASPRARLFAILESLPDRVELGRRVGEGVGTPPAADDVQAIRAAARTYRADQAKLGRRVGAVEAVRHAAAQLQQQQ